MKAQQTFLHAYDDQFLGPEYVFEFRSKEHAESIEAFFRRDPLLEAFEEASVGPSTRTAREKDRGKKLVIETLGVVILFKHPGQEGLERNIVVLGDVEALMIEGKEELKKAMMGAILDMLEGVDLKEYLYNDDGSKIPFFLDEKPTLGPWVADLGLVGTRFLPARIRAANVSEEDRTYGARYAYIEKNIIDKMIMGLVRFHEIAHTNPALDIPGVQQQRLQTQPGQAQLQEQASNTQIAMETANFYNQGMPIAEAFKRAIKKVFGLAWNRFKPQARRRVLRSVRNMFGQYVMQ